MRWIHKIQIAMLVMLIEYQYAVGQFVPSTSGTGWTKKATGFLGTLESGLVSIGVPIIGVGIIIYGIYLILTGRGEWQRLLLIIAGGALVTIGPEVLKALVK